MDSSKGKLSSWVEPKRLPTANDFRFSHPSRMAREDCYELASWIIRGEEGLNPPSQMFEWVGQVAGRVPRAGKRRSSAVDESIQPGMFVFFSLLSDLHLQVLLVSRLVVLTSQRAYNSLRRRNIRRITRRGLCFVHKNGNDIDMLSSSYNCADKYCRAISKAPQEET